MADLCFLISIILQTEAEMTADIALSTPTAVPIGKIQKVMKIFKEYLSLADEMFKKNDGTREGKLLKFGEKGLALFSSMIDLYKGLKPDESMTMVYKGVTEELSQLTKNMKERFESVNKLVLHVVFQNKVSIPSEQLWGRLMDYYEDPTTENKDLFIQECVKLGPAVPIMVRARSLLPNILHHTKVEQIEEWDQIIFMVSFKMFLVNVEYLMSRFPEPEFKERNLEYIRELDTAIYDTMKLLNDKEGKETEVPADVETLCMEQYQAILA